MQIVHGLNVENQENFQHQHQSKFAQSHDAHHPANILALPTELLYDALDYLSTEDLVSFAFCRWDMFHALIGFLERKARPSLEGLGLLVTLSEQPILRDLETLAELFEDNHWPKEQLRDIIIVSARRDQPTVHSCVELEFEEPACLYLRKSPHTLFDTNNLHMTVLHFSVLNRSQNIVQEIGSIAHNMREVDRVEFVNRHDDIQNTPLDYAIMTPSSTIVNMLISAGVSIDNTDRLGYTPLMNACHLGRDEIAHCLVDRGADIQATNNFNLSALESIMTGESRTKKTLLQRICPHATQMQLNRALWLAINDKKEFVGILLKFGADGQYAGNFKEDGLHHSEQNWNPSATTQGPVEASTPLSRRHLSPSIATGVTSREPGFLADLSPIITTEAGTDDGGIVDGFGTFRGSPIIIFRYGPDFVAKFSAKYTDGHGVSERLGVSSFDVRITQLRGYNDLGEYWRYSKENVVGIRGVAFEIPGQNL
ncbi:unnamed protein product [Penicillium viridicatum]